MHTITHRRKGQRRSYLKRFMSDTIHVHQAPMRSRPEGLTRTTNPVTGRKELHDMGPMYDTFALKARNQAAQEIFGNIAYVYNDKLVIDTSMGKMKLPVQRLPDGSIKLLRTEGPASIPRSVVLFEMAEMRTRDRIDTLHSIELERGRWTLVRYFFGGDKHLLVEMSLMRAQIKRSIVYPTREQLLSNYHAGCVTWASEQRIEKPSDIL